MSDLLSDLPGVWLNLDRRPDRADGFRQAMEPRLDRLERLAAVDGQLIHPDEVREFSVRCDAGRTSMDWYAGALGCLRSHVAAMHWGLERGHDRWLVFEDDATPTGIDHAPAPEEWNILLLGGTPIRAGKKRLAGWSKVTVWNCTHAYAVTLEAAMDLASAWTAERSEADVSWWPTLRRHEAQAHSPQLYRQVESFSDINKTSGRRRANMVDPT